MKKPIRNQRDTENPDLFRDATDVDEFSKLLEKEKSKLKTIPPKTWTRIGGTSKEFTKTGQS